MIGHRKRLDMLKSWAAHDASLYRSFINLVTKFGYTFDSTHVLDVGCGANASMTLMLHSAGVKVTGIDEYIGYRWGLGFSPSRYLRYLGEVGLPKTLRKVVGELVYDRHYYTFLAKNLGFSLTEKEIDLQEMKADNVQFANCTFDIVHSNATWEHLPNVKKANLEVARILRPGGIAYIEIHLFPSLSGGHDLPWIVPGKTELGDVGPWGHLRSPTWREPVYLNRLREKDYRLLFEETPALKIVDWRTEFTEGEEFLTDQLLNELSDYSREELTKRSIIVTLQRE